jgi:uncharacterized protein
MRPTNRRDLLKRAAGLGVVGLIPKMGWAAAGGPSYLAAAGLPDGRFELLGLGAGGAEKFRLPLPGRGHAAAAHPTRPEAVAFARRPGTFAVVIDCAEGRETARLTAPEGWNFGGHGAYSRDGQRLFTTESGPEGENGALGIWDAMNGYRRMGRIASGGIGPHEMLLMPDGRLAVANGGILTDPATGRAKLNLATMQPNLAFVDVEKGALGDVFEPPTTLRQLSLRHLAVARDGTLAMALQWEGSALQAPPLLGVLRPGRLRFSPHRTRSSAACAIMRAASRSLRTAAGRRSQRPAAGGCWCSISRARSAWGKSRLLTSAASHPAEAGSPAQPGWGATWWSIWTARWSRPDRA